MPLQGGEISEEKVKENKNATLSSMEGTKALMHQYWERSKKRPVSNKVGKHHSRREVAKEKEKSGREKERKENKLPTINNSFSEMRLAAFIKNKEKEKELLLGCKEDKPFEDYHIPLHFLDYKCQNDSPQFLRFQRVYYKRWA